MLNVANKPFMLSVIMLNAVMLSVEAPVRKPQPDLLSSIFSCYLQFKMADLSRSTAIIYSFGKIVSLMPIAIFVQV
jgi:hypothetical protein